MLSLLFIAPRRLVVVVVVVVVEITNTMHRFAPPLYSIYWLLHVSAIVCHHQGASGSV
jgi:hypothetical protein